MSRRGCLPTVLERTCKNCRCIHAEQTENCQHARRVHKRLGRPFVTHKCYKTAHCALTIWTARNALHTISCKTLYSTLWKRKCLWHDLRNGNRTGPDQVRSLSRVLARKRMGHTAFLLHVYRPVLSQYEIRIHYRERTTLLSL